MRRLLLLLAVFISIAASAQDYKILFLNTESIRIAGNNLKVGDCFNKSDKIQWADDKQAMKVLSLPDKKQFIFVSKEFKERKANTANVFVQTNRLSTRGAGSLSGVARKLGDTVYTIGDTAVEVDYVPDSSEYFYLMLEGRRHQLEYKDGALLFTADIWGDNDSVEVDVFYRYADGTEECVSEGIRIIPLPEMICTKKCCHR